MIGRLFKSLFGARSQFIVLNAAGDDVKQKSVRLGVQSLILTIIGAVLTIAFVVIATIFAQNVTTQTPGEEYTFPAMSFIGAIIFYAFVLASFLSCSLPGLRFAAFQNS